MGKQAQKKPKKKQSMAKAPKMEVEIDPKAHMLFERILSWQEEDEEILEFMEIEQSLRINILKKLIQTHQSQSLPFFSHLVDKGMALTEDIIEDLGKIKDEKTVELLLKIYGKSSDKGTNKAVRRALYKLKSQGLYVPDIWEMSLIQEGIELKESAYVSSINGLGERTLWLTSPRSGEKVDMRQIGIRDIKGIIAYSHLVISDQKFKELIEGQEGLPVVEVDPLYLRYLVEEAYKRNANSRMPLPKVYLSERDFWQKGDILTIKPLIYEVLNEEEVKKDRGALGSSKDLFNTDEMAKWRLEENEVEEYTEKLEEVRESRLTINEIQRQEQIMRALEEATDNYFSEETREIMKRRLEEMALVFFKTGKREEAKQCLAAALAFGNYSLPPRDNPFAMEMIKKSIKFIYEEMEEEEEEKPSSLIVLP